MPASLPIGTRLAADSVAEAVSLMLPGDLPDPFLQRPAWHAQAACRGMAPETFVVPIGAPTAPARAICEGCSVRGECLSYALADPSLQGVWAGTTAQERRTMRQLGRASARPAYSRERVGLSCDGLARAAPDPLAKPSEL
jgi:WhiB family redox-sensing transcriptional regulator